ncbi:MAG: 1-deoxy-D-xylulose-5-phosphate synthase, partial [Gammaproteobacteria bacterium]|nr:1-deoxy-D-xylulose-5-phosphate synthase [Gammaproteobacteria bacterium]
VRFAKEYPDRYFDVGIAEQHSVTLAAGMACEGLKPVVAIYSTFLQRGYDQLIHDVAVQNLDVMFAIDRAGVVGPDGPTHAGSFDLSYLRCIPNMLVMAPSDENECRQMLYTGITLDQPAAVRYPRGAGPGVTVEQKMQALPIGKAETRREGKTLAIMSFGHLLETAMFAGEELDATVINMRFVKPLDEELILEMAKTHNGIITLEENAIAGGAGSAVSELLAANDLQIPLLHLGIPDVFIEHGSQESCRRDAGLDNDSVLTTIRRWWPVEAKAQSL